MGMKFRGLNVAPKVEAETQGKGGEEGKGESTAAWKMKDAGKLILSVFNVNLAAAGSGGPGVTAAPPPIFKASPLGAATPADSSPKLQYVEGRDDYTVPAGSDITLHVDCDHALAGMGSNHGYIEFRPTGSTGPWKRLDGEYTVAPKDVTVFWTAANTQPNTFYKFTPDGPFGIAVNGVGNYGSASVARFRTVVGNAGAVRTLKLRPKDLHVANMLASRELA